MTETRILGRGAFGIVTQEIDESGRAVARKTFKPWDETMLDADRLDLFRRRFRREVTLISSVHHPNVIEVFRADLTGERPYYEMPIAERTLRQQLGRDRKDMGSSLFGIWDLLAGLEALHVQGLVHKDIKPENVLLVDHEWRLADFGLASGVDANDLDGSLGGCRGTMKYLAPEQYSSLQHATIQSDIYSVGCILHDICGTEERIPLRKHTAPGNLGAIIEQATAEVADLRIPSVWMLRDEIGHALQEQSFRLMPIDVMALQTALREVGRRIERETIWKTALALESSLEHQARVFLAYALTERVIAQMYRTEAGLSDRIAFGVCRLAREGGMVNPLDVDRIVSRLRLFGELGDTKVKAAVATAMLVLGVRTRRASVSWWLARLLSMADAHLISRLEVAAPMIAARIDSIRSAISIVRNSGFDLDPRIVALLTQAAKMDKKTA